MHPISTLLRTESPLDLAREALWRARRSLQRKGVATALQNGVCDVRFRHANYFRPDLQSCTTTSRRTLLAFADLVVDGKFPFLGYGTVALGIPPAWNCDFVSGKEWPHIDASRIPFVCPDGSDIKAPWELSRLQFLPVLAKAHLLSGKERYRETAKKLASQWIEANPVGIGVNWTIAMEMALRSISVCLLLDLLWPLRPEEQSWLGKVTRSLWEHLSYIEANLEFSYFVRSNHYLSNIVGLLCLATFLEGSGMERRRRRYQKLVEEEILQQTYEDGGDYEASSGYHVLVTQMFTCALLLMRASGAEPAKAFVDRLRRMYEFAGAVADSGGRMPHIGDCDDGRVELLLDDLDQMVNLPVPQRHSLTIANLLGIGTALLGTSAMGRFDDAVWYGLPREHSCGQPEVLSNPVGCQLFSKSGVAVARHGRWDVLFLAIPNGGFGRGSHTHNDKLSVVLRCDGEELFCDSGTGVYSRDPVIRNCLRSTAAHNTILIDGTEQNRIARDQLFLIGNEAQVAPIQWQRIPQGHLLTSSHFGYRALQVTHCRRLRLAGEGLVIEDVLTGSGEHTFEINLHISSGWKVELQNPRGNVLSCRLEGLSSVDVEIASPVHMQLESLPALRSRSYGFSFVGQRLCIRGQSTLPITIVTQLAPAATNTVSLESLATPATRQS